MKLAFLFAGQGSQVPGLGKELYDAFPQVRPIYDEPQPGFDLREISFEAPMEVISQTRYTQPCMVAFAAAVTRLLREEGLRPDYAAGLSLGEYSALCCAGVLDPRTAVELAAFRGRAMEEAAAGRSTGMTALLGVTPETAEECCRRAREETGLTAEVANLNCPGQVVIGGDAPAVERAAALAREAGAKRCLPLNVSGPFHTSLMAPAGKALAERFQTLAFAPMGETQVVFNATARPLDAAAGETVPGLLVRQVQSPTLFEESIRWMASQGVDTVVEIGPGKVLSGFVKKIAPETALYQAQDAGSIREIGEALKGAQL